MNLLSRRPIVPLLIAVLLWFSHQGQAIEIEFDFTYDTKGFFGAEGSAQRAALEEAASFFEVTFGDTLDAITPEGGNSWKAVFFDPTNSGSNISETNLTIAADTLYIFVGSEDRGPGNLGLAAPGGYTISAVTQSFVDSITTRGETGMETDDDFGTWGGAISFNDDESIDWSFDTVNGPGATEHDFYSTAVHEIAHVMGFSIADSFTTRVNDSDEFTGAASFAENGNSNVQLTPDGHVDENESSTVFGGSTTQVPLMADSASAGDSLVMTDLDIAMLQDTGWEVVPEPGSALLFIGGSALLLFRRRRR